MIKLSLNIAKIPSGRTIPGKNGNRYLGLVLIENKDGPDQYGNDGFIKLDTTKEEREAKAQLPIVGNWKHIGGKPAAPKPQPTPAPRPQADVDLDSDEVPF